MPNMEPSGAAVAPAAAGGGGPRKPVEHIGFRCDNCGEEPIRGVRYKCVNCADFDLCHTCEELGVHDTAHTFLKIRIPTPSECFPFVPAPVPNRAAQPPAQTQGQHSQQAVTAPTTGLYKRLFEPGPDNDANINPPSPEFVDSVNRFGFQVLHRLMAYDAASGASALNPVGLSAPNIYTCLIMAATGSEGSTREAFAQTLGFQSLQPRPKHQPHGGRKVQQSDVDQAARDAVMLESYCTRTARASGGNVELSTGASVWHHERFMLASAWRSFVEWNFGALVRVQDAGRMNGWVAENTRGKIRKIVEEGMMDSPVMLVTCLYFKANWETPFERRFTIQDAKFERPGASEQRCAMMRHTGTMPYWEDDVAQVCILPYASEKKDRPSSSSFGDPFSTSSSPAPLFGSSAFHPTRIHEKYKPKWKAAIILPKTRGAEAISNIVQHFSSTPTALRSLLDESISRFDDKPGVRSEFVDLSLPRFTLRLQSHLQPTLSNMGLSSAFYQSSAEFGRMSGPGNADNVYLGGVAHHFFIEVNEEGTEMAAVTATLFGGAGGVPPPPKKMTVDRPFLFMVYEQRTMTVLGSVVVSSVGEERPS